MAKGIAGNKKSRTKKPSKTTKRPSKSKRPTKGLSKGSPPARPNASTCIVNNFLVTIDKELSTKIASDIPCKDVYKLIEKVTAQFPEVPEKLIVSAKKFITKGLECRGDVVANINELRRIVVRIDCVLPEGPEGEIKLKLKKEPANEPPLPKGFVKPRNWDPEWDPEWAKEHGWIFDPYYDWLMPSVQIDDDEEDDDEEDETPSKPVKLSKRPSKKMKPAKPVQAPAVVAPSKKTPVVTPVVPPVVTPTVAPVPVPIPVPVQKAPESQPKAVAPAPEPEQPEPEATEQPEKSSPGLMTKIKPMLKWGLALIVVLALAWFGYKMYSKFSSGGGSNDIGATQVDDAFENSAPPTDMSNDMPNTTELMNDLGESPKSGRRRR